MSEKEKDFAEIIGNAIHNMSEFDKGYFLAKAESVMERTNRDAATPPEPEGTNKQG